MTSALLTINFDAKRPVGEVYRALAAHVLVRSSYEQPADPGRKRMTFSITSALPDAPQVQQDTIRKALGADTRVLGAWYEP